MTPDELRDLYTKAVKIARAEKKMRQYVFANQPDKCAAKVAEMEELERILTALKDELKQHIGADYEQPTLLDVPRKAVYG